MSIFSKIIRGEIPSYKVYEDELTLAFLDIHPLKPGHTLIVPKTEVDVFYDVPEPFYSAVFKAGKIVGKALKEVTNCKRVGTTILGFDVPHFHLHVVPMWDVGDLDFGNFRKAIMLSPEDMASMQKQLVDMIYHHGKN